MIMGQVHPFFSPWEAEGFEKTSTRQGQCTLRCIVPLKTGLICLNTGLNVAVPTISRGPCPYGMVQSLVAQTRFSKIQPSGASTSK